MRYGGAFVALAMAVAWRFHEPGYGVLFWPWVAGLACYIASFPSARHVSRREPLLSWFVLGAILLLAAVLRFPGVEDVPANISVDELLPALESQLLADGAKPNAFSTIGWFTIPNLAFLPGALAIKLSWLQPFHAVRIASGLTGIAGILATYLLGLRLLGVRAALAGAYFMAVAFWHLHNSRTGFPYAQSSFAPPLVLCLIIGGIQERSHRRLALAGVVCGLALQLYFPVRILLLLVPLFFVVAGRLERVEIRDLIRQAGIFLLGVLLVLTPLLVRMDPKGLVKHSGEILITHPSILREMRDRYRVDTFHEVLERNLWESSRMLTQRAEVAVLNFSPSGLLDRGTLVVFLTGIVLTLLSGRPEPLLLVAWVVLTFVFGVAFTNSPRGSYRFAPAMPAIFLLAGYTVGCALLVTEGRRRWYRSLVRMLVILALAGWLGAENYRLFFVEYVRGDGRPFPWPMALRYLAAHCDGRRFYIFPRSDRFTEAEFVDVFCPDHYGIEAEEVPAAIATDRPVTFLLMAPLPRALAVLKRCYPASELAEHKTPEGVLLFFSMDVSVADLVEAPGRCKLPRADEPRQRVGAPDQWPSNFS